MGPHDEVGAVAVARATRFAEYVTHANRRYIDKHERLGQAYLNALSDLRPDLAEEAQGTVNDPFYNEAALGRFLEFVHRRI